MTTTPALPGPFSFDDIEVARDALASVAHRTPVLRSTQVDRETGAQVFFKCENLQRIGAFKFRGAYAALSRFDDEQRAQGVLTYSSGNHAAAVALASSLLDIRATIVMPSDAPAAKLAATAGYLGEGSEIVEYDRATTTREALAATLLEERGGTLLPPYDHPWVIAGQGTVAVELHEQVAALVGEPLDRLYVCCGGGGLLSGCAVATRAMVPSAQVIGVEPALADDAARSFRTGVLHVVQDPPTIADGARTPSLGAWTFPLVLQNVDGFETVSEAEIASAMRMAAERMKLVVEPAGALAFAGVRQVARLRPDELRGQRVGVILSGGNVDTARLSELFGLADLD